MQVKNTRTYEIVTWQEISKQVHRVSPDIAAAIDALDPPQSWKIVKARYSFGDEIIQKGELFVPDQTGELIGIHDNRFYPELRKLLGYTCVPIGMNLQGTTEVFADHQETPIPLSFMIPGRFYALWMGLDTDRPFFTKFWSMVAGTRALFFLPKIADGLALKKLGKELGTTLYTPHNLWDQPRLLKELVPFDPNPWSLETIFFSKIWFDEGVKQQTLRSILLNQVWRATRFLRTNIFFEITYSQAQAEKNIKIDPYLIDTIKHLYYLGTGTYPGFVFANSDMVGPIRFFQKLFNDVYQLQYAPTMMHLDYLRPSLQKSLFYSLQLPTLLEFSPKARERATNIDILYYLQTSMKRLNHYILNEKERLSGLDLYDWATQVDYAYYHPHPTDNQAIHSVNELVQTEPILQQEEKTFQKPFCETNSFMRGLIKLKYE